MCEICYYNVDSIYSLKRGGDVGVLYKNQSCIFIKDPFPFVFIINMFSANPSKGGDAKLQSLFRMDGCQLQI